ncbi:zinc knuckle (CCHC-type) family protein [Zea mays]|uniref:Zinc knuckle (CCHC-type) family protein n=2 Tax=Zea mays TaxID=4577 RepID=A0A1D6QL04_MAIZE|nr:zinc knuckle (CCHC-type) family protein [Zea mays]
MAERWRSRARRDPDLDEDASPPSRQPRHSGGDEEDDELGNEDLSLEIVARAQRKRRGESAGGVPVFADLLSVSSADEEGAVVELDEADEPRRKQKKKQRRKQRKKHRKETTEAAAGAAVEVDENAVCSTEEGPIGTAESVLTENGADAPASDNMVLRKLLRIPRYFDPGETLLETCFNCSEEGHVAANCPLEKRKKPCFVCGLFGHNAKQCTQKSLPLIIAFLIMQKIRCYVCNQKGHLCCSDFSDDCPKQISCYNCAQSGHSGLGCAKRRETSAVTTPTLCFKCGEEGHFARGCTKNAKSDRSKGKSSSHIQRKEKWKKASSSARSAPYDARKTSKRKSPHLEERVGTPRHKPKSRGGWTGGDDLPLKKYKSNGWGSPSTPKKSYANHQFLSGCDYLTPQPSRRHNYHGTMSSPNHQFLSGCDYFTPESSRGHSHGTMSPNWNYSPSARKHGFSSSRFAAAAASNTHVRFGRN